MKTHFSTSNRSRITGFTLVELLVTISIIAILAALVFTVGRRMQIASKSAASVSQLRQIATAVTGYTAEHGGLYPPSWYQASNLSAVEFLNPYIHPSDYLVRSSPFGEAIYQAPEARRDSVFISPFRTDITEFKRWSHPHSYGPNPLLMPELPRDAEENRIHVTKVTRPAQIVMYADIWTSAPKGGGSASFKGQPELGSGTSGLDQPVEVIDEKIGALHFQHGRLHTAMADGSARVFREGELKKRNLVFGPDERF